MATTDTDDRRPILVPVDFSRDATAALVWAADLADRLGQPLLILHVVHDPASAPGYYRDGEPSRQVQPLEDAATRMLDEFIERVRRDHPENRSLQQAETNLAVGLPPTRILEVAAQRGASLIVMGSQGRTGLAHLLLGSKAQRVAQLSPIPITIVKAQDEPA